MMKRALLMPEMGDFDVGSLENAVLHGLRVLLELYVSSIHSGRGPEVQCFWLKY